MIDEYLEILEREARAAGIEPARLVEEASDHLNQTATVYEAMGYTTPDARSIAITQFGEPRSIVMSMSSTSGGSMSSRIRAFVIALGAATTVTLWIGHVAPSQEITHTPFEPMLIVAVAIMGVTAVGLLAGINRIAAFVAAPAAAFSVWAIASSAVGKIGFQVEGGNYLWVIVGTAVLISGVCTLFKIRGGIGIGLLTAGLVGMILNGAWEPTGGLGDGQGNIPVLVVTLGWAWLVLAAAGSWWRRPPAVRARYRVAASLISAARRLSPETTVN